jgi:rod shape-determining protein MreC
MGRVIASGNRSARILLLTDLNSRIPVMVEGVNLKAILTGDNSVHPSLEYLPSGARIPAGARVVTTPDGGVFPPGIPVGVVAGNSRTPRVNLFTGEGRADFVRILSYTAKVDVNAAVSEPLPGATTEQPSPAVAPEQPKPNSTPAPAAPAGPAAAAATPALAPTAQATPPAARTAPAPAKPSRVKPSNADEPFRPPAPTIATPAASSPSGTTPAAPVPTAN